MRGRESPTLEGREGLKEIARGSEGGRTELKDVKEGQTGEAERRRKKDLR